MDYLRADFVGGLGDEMGQVTVQECRKRMIVFGKLVEYTDAVDYSIVFPFLNDFFQSGEIGGVAGDAFIEEFRFFKGETCYIVTLFLKIQRYLMSGHAVTSEYKKFHLI